MVCWCLIPIQSLCKALNFSNVVDIQRFSCCFWILHVDPLTSLHPSLPRWPLHMLPQLAMPPSPWVNLNALLPEICPRFSCCNSHNPLEECSPSLAVSPKAAHTFVHLILTTTLEAGRRRAELCFTNEETELARAHTHGSSATLLSLPNSLLSSSAPLAQGSWAHLCEIASFISRPALFQIAAFPGLLHLLLWSLWSLNPSSQASSGFQNLQPNYPNCSSLLSCNIHCFSSRVESFPLLHHYACYFHGHFLLSSLTTKFCAAFKPSSMANNWMKNFMMYSQLSWYNKENYPSKCRSLFYAFYKPFSHTLHQIIITCLIDAMLP